MPNYSLKCPKCNHEWEDFISISERENVTCPLCGEKAVTNYSKTGTVLIKGQGFYQESTVR